MRQPYQVLVIPYNLVNSTPRYYVFLTKKNFWQFVSGGGENNETVVQTAIRELFEETKIITDSLPEQLTSVASIPVSAFDVSKTQHWGDKYVVPEYSFAINIGKAKVVISDEHVEFRAVTFEEANKLLKYDSNKTALYELNRKLQSHIGVGNT